MTLALTLRLTAQVGQVTSTGGMVVSDQAIASRVGAEIMQKGGNAVDAAVATGFALTVTTAHYRQAIKGNTHAIRIICENGNNRPKRRPAPPLR